MSDAFPLTDLQEAYVVGSSRLVELGGMHPTYTVELDAAGLDPARAAAATERLIARHEQLRTVIVPDAGQRVLEGVPPFDLVVEDLCGLPPERRDAVIRRTRERLLAEGVDPTRWPLFRIVVQRTRAHRARVHVAMSLLLLDGHSIRRVVAEWLALCRDPAAPLPPPGATYRECRLAMRDAEAGEAFQAQWRYWQARLDSLPAGPDLPLARPLREIDPVRFTRREGRLTRGQWSRLRSRFLARRVLANAALLEVYASVLGAWASAPRFCLNVLHRTPFAARGEAADVVGQLGSTLALEVDLGRGADLFERAQLLQGQLWRDSEHGDVSGVRVMREVARRRGWAPRPLLPCVFTNMVGADVSRTLRAPGLRVCSSGLLTPQVLIDNQVQDAGDGGITFAWDVVDEAFPAGLPDLMFTAYRELLEELGGPAERPGLRPVPAAHDRLVAAINDTRAPLPDERLEAGFLRRAAAEPDTVAVVAPDRTLTYGELEARSRAVARWLRERRLGREDLVPVVMARGWAQVVAVLGVLRAGAAYCPLDAALPSERLRHLLEACGSPVALVDGDRDLPASREALRVDLLGPGAGDLPGCAGSPGDLAYVIHTSGSTGRPKGVMIEHRAAVNTVAAVNARIGLGPADRVFGISSLSFDLAVWDVFGALAAGAALVLPAAGTAPDPEGWAAAARAGGVTVWNSVPALAEMLAEAQDGRPAPPIRAFLLSGDWIPVSLPGRLRARWPGARVVAMGGATEAAIWSNVFEVEAVDPSWRSIPYGRPLPNQTMRVLDDRLEVRPPWAVGRIHIGGAGLARGYLGDPERTAERFVWHPATGERLYWTGDLGRHWPDGTIELLGREDDQVKVQGFRVEPGEVEAAIAAHPGVRDCVVRAEGEAGGPRRLVALAVPAEGAAPTGAELLDHARALLPHYMVPARLEVVAGLPLTANGKVDVARALACAAPAPAAGSGDAPASAAERTLGRLFGELLGVPAVGPADSFLALGGSSLLTLRLVRRVRAELGVDLPFGRVFESPTVRDLARWIEAADGSGGSAVDLSSRPGTPLWLFHPVGGSVSAYGALARAWAGPVTAFQSRALALGPGAADPDVGAMAARYRDELLHRQPEAPHLLGGWSMGGVLAHEVGRLLAAAGHRPVVFMIDSEVPWAPVPATARERHVEFVGDLAGGPPPSLAPDGDAAVAARDACAARGLLPADIDLAGYLALFEVHAGNSAALAAHRPGPSPVPTLLLVAGEEGGRPDPVPGWRRLCSALEVEVWPRDHHSIAGPEALAAVAARVAGWVAAFDAGVRR